MRKPPALKWTAIGLASVLGLVLLLFALIQTPPGKWALAKIASSAASGNGLQVEISELGGFLPWNVTVGKLVLSDGHGVFAEGEQLKVKWHPWALVNGTLSIDDLQAAQIDFKRKPDLPPAKDKRTKSGGLPNMLVDRIAIDRILLGESLLGDAAQLSLHATVDNSAALTRFDFDAQRLDAPGSLKGSASFARNGQMLDVDFTADEPPGGVMVRLLNVEGRPTFHAAVKGHGSLDQWDGTLAIKAGSAAMVDGKVTIFLAQGGHRATLSLTGALAKLLPGDIAALFEGDTKIDAAVLVNDKALVTVESFTAQSAGFDATVGGTFDAQTFLSDLRFELKTKDSKRFAGLLPPGTAFGALVAQGTIAGPPEKPIVVAKLNATDVAGAGYRVGNLSVDVKTAPSGNGTLSFTLDGHADELSADDPVTAKALSGSLHLSAIGTMTAQRELDVTKAVLTGIGIDAQFDGHASPAAVVGNLRVTHFNLATVAPLLGRRVSGQAAFTSDIDSTPERFIASIDGKLDGFASDDKQLDALLAPSTSLNGQIRRNADGALIVSGIKAKSDAFDLTADGRLDKAVADLKLRAKLTDLAILDPRMTGAATADIAFSGNLDKLGVRATMALPSGKAMGNDVENLSLAIDAQDLTGKVTGMVKLDGMVGGKPAKASAKISPTDDGGRKLDAIALAIGSVTGQGALVQTQDGMISGEIALKAANLADLSPLALTPLAGQLDGVIKFDSDKDKQRVTIDATGNNIRAADLVLGGARIKLTVLDPAGTPAINGTAELANVKSGSLLIDKANLTATQNGDGTDLHVVATSLGAAIDATGRLSAKDGAPVLTLTALKASRDQASAVLAAPATLTFIDGGVRIDKFALNTNGGSVVLNGTAGNTLNLNAELRGLPLSLLTLLMPDIDATGTLSGTIALTGSANAPNGQYDLTVAKARTPRLARAGLGPFDVKASGKLGGGRITVDAKISAPSLQGIAVVGSLPLGKGELDLAIKGQAGLNLINTALATTGAYASGNLVIDATVKGTADAPLVAGTAHIANGRFNDAINGITFDKIQAEIVAEGRQLALRSFTAQTSNDGTLTASGTVSLDPQAGFPGNLQINAQKARLISNETVRLVADAKLTLTGPLATTPKLSGRIDVRSMDVNIPDKLPGSLNATEVRHINVPNADKSKIETPQTKTQQRKDAKEKMVPAAVPFVAALDLTINAPNRVFVRGRGMEAELGGTIKLTGTSVSPITNGSFELRHGRLDVIDRRLNFTRGRIAFHGSTDPELDFAAESKSAEITASVLITGRASAPKISFASTPSLPEDEILARLLFGKPAGTLTPGQAIQVARAISQFSGSGNHRLDDVRRSLGISSLDIGTGENGSGGQVGIGKRLNDNVYLGVSQGTAANSGQVSVDVDLTKHIKVQGKAGAAGGEVGIGAEWDY